MIARIIFILTIVCIILWLNTFFLYHFYRLFSIKVDRSIYLAAFVLTALLPIWMIAHTTFPNIFTRYLYIFAASWLWFVFISFVITFIFDITINFLNIHPHYKAFIWLSAILSVSIYAFINESWLPTIRDITMKSPKIKQDINIWYLSDVHIDWINDISYLEAIIDKLNTLDIDVVLINWDLVDGTSFERHSFKVLDKLKVPIYITLWNHESYIGRNYAISLFKDTKAKVLNNEMVEFKWLQIIWSEDLMWMQHKLNEEILTKVLDYIKWDKDKPSLLLLHEPIWSELADSRGIDFQLAWHTHVWQIWPFNYLVKMAFPRIYWYYKIWNLQLYVWSGTWVWGPPMRLGSQNEITIIHLKK